MASLLFGSVFLATLLGMVAAQVLAAGRHRRVLEILWRVERQRLAHEHGQRVSAALRRGATSTLRRLLERLAPIAGGGARPDLGRRLMWADAPLSSEQFTAAKLLCAVAGSLGGLAVGALARSETLGLAAACLGALGGYLLPDVWLASALARRRAIIDRELLYFLDFLALAAQAGLPLDAAVEHVAREFPGLLSRAFAQVQSERGLGQWNEHALAGLAERLGHPEVAAVVQALARAGRFGSRTAPLLRELAGTIRRQRNEAAREHANRVGAAIILPVALFILPVVVVILGYPAVAAVSGALAIR